MTTPGRVELEQVLSGQPPFNGLDPAARTALAAAARVASYRPGELILDAFTKPSVQVFLVLAGQVDVWNDASRIHAAADERVGPGGIFGFSAMLTERSVGPRVVAVAEAVVAGLPAAEVSPAFSSPDGARFLAARGPAPAGSEHAVSYSLVDDLIPSAPLVVRPDASVLEVARAMTERHIPYAAVALDEGGFGLVTDALLRERALVGGLPDSTPARAVMDTDVPTAMTGDSAAEALILLLEREAELLLVLDRSGRLRGVISPRDFAVSPTTVGVSLHEQLRRAATVDQLARRARRIPPTLSDLLSRGLSSGRVIALHSGMIDTVIRRAITLILADHAELSSDAFTWLALGSNGRREAVLSSDVDSAVAFADELPAAEMGAYRDAFGEVDGVLADAGLSSDSHGATARRPAFSRRHSEWRAAAQAWLKAPEKNQGAMMTSLLVDGRPIHGDIGLPAVAEVFGDLRGHPGTMRLLLEESLSRRARLHSMREIFTRRADTFDIKRHALQPIINLARWAALSVDSAVLGTPDRLRAVAGSTMLPAEQVENLVEIFDVLQRIRLRYQLLAYQRGQRPSNELTLDRMSPIDRGLVTDAVRAIAGVQRRVDNIAVYLPPSGWTARPAP